MHNRDYILAAATAWFIGLSALFCDHLQPSLPLIVGTRALFAIATCGAIWLVLIAKARTLAGLAQVELYQFTRLVSRWVYILLYALAVMRVSLYLYEASRHCSLCKATNTPDSVRSLDDFQFYVICCVAPLWAARAWVLAAPFNTGTATK